MVQTSGILSSINPPLADVYSDSVQHHWDNSLISQLYPDVACGAVWAIFSASGPFAP